VNCSPDVPDPAISDALGAFWAGAPPPEREWRWTGARTAMSRYVMAFSVVTPAAPAATP
jgi:hypothetical protein